MNFFSHDRLRPAIRLKSRVKFPSSQRRSSFRILRLQSPIVGNADTLRQGWTDGLVGKKSTEIKNRTPTRSHRLSYHRSGYQRAAIRDFLRRSAASTRLVPHAAATALLRWSRWSGVKLVLHCFGGSERELFGCLDSDRFTS